MKSLHLHLAVIFFAACQKSCEKEILSALCVCHSVCSYSGVPYEATPQRPTVQGLDLGSTSSDMFNLDIPVQAHQHVPTACEQVLAFE